MPDHYSITPANIADQLDITIITLRRWCVAYAAHLSPLANPEPGQTRRFTSRDREVLKHVKTLRDQGRSLADIADLLADLTFPEIDPSGQEDTTITVVDLPEAHQETRVNALIVSTLETVQRRLDAIEQAKPNASQRDYVQGLAVGFVGALLFMVLLLLLFLVRGYL